MARKNLEGKIHIYYTPEFVAWYNAQSQKMKEYADQVGKDKGYSGMNVCYLFLLAYLTRRAAKHKFIPMQKK